MNGIYSKSLGAVKSNTWVDTPLKWDSELTVHDHIETVLNVIPCGIDETKVIRVRQKDVIKAELS
jgi:hypothetical protein